MLDFSIEVMCKVKAKNLSGLLVKWLGILSVKVVGSIPTQDKYVISTNICTMFGCYQFTIYTYLVIFKYVYQQSRFESTGSA